MRMPPFRGHDGHTDVAVDERCGSFLADSANRVDPTFTSHEAGEIAVDLEVSEQADGAPPD